MRILVKHRSEIVNDTPLRRKLITKLTAPQFRRFRVADVAWIDDATGTLYVSRLTDTGTTHPKAVTRLSSLS